MWYEWTVNRFILYDNWIDMDRAKSIDDKEF